MSGTITLSGQQQFDPQGNPLTGGLLYTLQSGTVVPQNGFKDLGLVNVYSNPITLDASGRIPPVYFVDGSIRIRLTDRTGVLLLDYDNLPVVGGSSSGAIVDTTDPNSKYNTGDFKIRYGTGALAGFVRANGLTIGPASSGASERANADCQALFTYLWGLNDPNLPVAPSRGGSAATDWASTSPFKTIQLPDLRGRVFAGADKMGSAFSSGQISANNIATPDVLGSFGGFDRFLLDINSLPTHNHGVQVDISESPHSHTVPGGAGPAGVSSGAGSAANFVATSTGSALTGITATGTVFNAGNGQPHYTLQPTMIVTIYIRL